MVGRTATGAGRSNPRTPTSRTELLRLLLAERFLRPRLYPARTSAEVVERRRAILLGEDMDDG